MARQAGESLYEQRKAQILAALANRPMFNPELATYLGWKYHTLLRVARRMDDEGILAYGTRGSEAGWVATDPVPVVEVVPTPVSPAPVPAVEVVVSAPGSGSPANWPRPMSDAAYIGLAGDLVRLVSPQSEGDPHALLLSFLVSFGMMAGRNLYYLVEATHHISNEFTVIVGDSSTARKGTATDRVSEIMRLVNSDYESLTTSGLATGAGLIYSIRDPLQTGNKLDEGVVDKRKLFSESEFSSVLRSLRTNKLSEDLRNAWDGKRIGRQLRREPYFCQKPHVAIIGSTTAEELRGLFKTVDQANGLGNRFLWCCARRAQLLPNGGRPLNKAQLKKLVAGIQAALEMARQTERRITWDKTANKLWAKTYGTLGRGSGFLQAMTARADAHVARLAMLYALLDSSAVIRLEHLQAALSIWQFCSDSVSYLFSNVLV
jgi:hypothetical protein